MAADVHSRVYIRGRGPPPYVTHFLYHIPRLYCVSSPVSFLQFGANSYWRSSQELQRLFIGSLAPREPVLRPPETNLILWMLVQTRGRAARRYLLVLFVQAALMLIFALPLQC